MWEDRAMEMLLNRVQEVDVGLETVLKEYLPSRSIFQFVM